VRPSRGRAVVSSIGSLLPHIQAGGLRTLATAAARRSTALPDVPTVREAGYPALEPIGTGRMGVFVPARTPAGVIASLNRAVGVAVATPAVQAGFDKLGLDPLETAPAAFAQSIAAETRVWAEAVQASGFKPME
jgi:tripartite-type tricarboxylate transporter receptor subunit TctC